MKVDAVDIRKERKRCRDRIRAKEKYDAWKALPPELRGPSYYELHKEARKEYSRIYYQNVRRKRIEEKRAAFKATSV